MKRLATLLACLCIALFTVAPAAHASGLSHLKDLFPDLTTERSQIVHFGGTEPTDAQCVQGLKHTEDVDYSLMECQFPEGVDAAVNLEGQFFEIINALEGKLFAVNDETPGDIWLAAFVKSHRVVQHIVGEGNIGIAATVNIYPEVTPVSVETAKDFLGSLTTEALGAAVQ